MRPPAGRGAFLASMEPGSEEPGDDASGGNEVRDILASMEPGSEEPGDATLASGNAGRGRCFNGAGF